MTSSDRPLPDPGTAAHAVRVQLPAHPRAASQARAATAEFLAQEPVPPTLDDDDVLLAVSELVTNAVQAGAHRVDLQLAVAADAFMIVVEDDAPGWPAAQEAPADSEHGRGLAIVSHLADEWRVEETGSGKRVAAIFSVA